MSNKIELKPCPFCGGTAALYANDGVCVICQNCGAMSTTRKDMLISHGVAGNAVEAVIHKWNQRAVEKWSQEYPKRTILMDFLAKYPNAPKDEDGIPNLMPKSLGYCKDVAGCYTCKKGEGETARWCWEQEVEDDE